ncbi:MAG: M56 family metallopeptidase, partial [Terriglobales bacterium]
SLPGSDARPQPDQREGGSNQRWPCHLELGVVGWLRPKLLLPADIAKHLAPDQLRAVLGHELCHIRRRDNLAAALHMAVETIFWFHPLVWWIGSRMVDERERACDEEVLRLGAEPHAYAQGILGVCRWYVESAAPWAAGVGGGGLKARIQFILAGRPPSRLGRVQQIALAAAGAAALTLPIAAGMLPQAAPAPPLRFDVASVRELGPGPVLTGHYTVGVHPLPGRITAQCADLYSLLVFAYHLPLYPPVAGLPSWGRAPCGMATFVNTFQIEAAMPAGTTDAQVRQMMQSLLADRFKLAVHWDTRPGKVFALVVIPGATVRPGNPAVDDRPVKPHSIACPAQDRNCNIYCCGDSTMADFASMLASSVNRPVVDKTGLTGEYFNQMIWAGDLSVDSPLPSLQAALKEKGLELRAETGPIPRLVIDHVEKPSPN